MNPLDRVYGYLDDLERRLRWSAIAKGAAVVALAALAAVFSGIVNVCGVSSRIQMFRNRTGLPWS